MADLLRIENLSAGYGEAVVLTGINVSIAEGQTGDNSHVLNILVDRSGDTRSSASVVWSASGSGDSPASA